MLLISTDLALVPDLLKYFTSHYCDPLVNMTVRDLGTWITRNITAKLNEMPGKEMELLYPVGTLKSMTHGN